MKNENEIVFMSRIPRNYTFVCTMMRRDLHPNIGDDDVKKLELIYELFQNAVRKVKLHSTKNGTTISIDAANVEDPSQNRTLWSLIHSLVDSDSTSEIHIYNNNESGEQISVEKYIVSDISIELERDCTSSDIQMIKINGNINTEIQE